MLIQPKDERTTINFSIVPEQTGNLFRKKLDDFLMKFKEEHEKDLKLSFEDINENSSIAFIFISKIKSIFKSIDEL
jgi:hypothetical protein